MCRLAAAESELIHELAQIEQIRWIRVLYCYPEEIYEDLIRCMKTEKTSFVLFWVTDGIAVAAASTATGIFTVTDWN